MSEDISNKPAPRRVIVVGGGITGLSAAYSLQERAAQGGKPVEIVLLEGDDRLGGKIRTEHVDGFTIEGGPDCFLRQKPWAAQLCRRMGIGDALIGTNDDRRKTYVVNRGRLTPLPDGVMLIIPTRITPFALSPLISIPGKIRMGMDFFIPRRTDGQDESVADFVRRRLGTEALEKIAEPLLSGIHVSDPEKQSLLGTFPRFRKLEENHGSLIRGMLAQRRSPGNNGSQPAAGAAEPGPGTLFITLREGMNQMVAALERRMAQDQIVLGAQVARLERTPEGYRVTDERGRTWEAEAVIVATPAFNASSLVKPLHPDLSTFLGNIRYISTATISLGFAKAEIGHRLNGFGYVTPRKEKRQVGACTWTSTKFDHRVPADGALLRCFVGGPGREQLVDLSDAELTSLARQELNEMMGIRAEPRLVKIFRWYKANPQYDVGHLERIEAMRKMSAAVPGLFLAGSAYDGVGIPDCVRQGEQAAAQAYQYVESRE